MFELAETFHAGDAVDPVRESVRIVMEELIKAAATERICAVRYQRTQSRTTECNASREQLPTTKGGDVEPRIPKLRKGSFFPSTIEPRRRMAQALYAVVMEAYVHRVWTHSYRRPDRLFGVGSGISKSDAFRIYGSQCEVGVRIDPPLDHVECLRLPRRPLPIRQWAAGPGHLRRLVFAIRIPADGSR